MISKQISLWFSKKMHSVYLTFSINLSEENNFSFRKIFFFRIKLKVIFLILDFSYRPNRNCKPYAVLLEFILFLDQHFGIRESSKR